MTPKLNCWSFLYLLQRSFVAAFDDNCFGIAKGAAYSALLSFFPVLASAATLLVQTKADFVARTISRFLFEIVPPGTEELVRYQLEVKGQRPVLLLVTAALLSLWAASRVVASLIEGFQAAYRIPRNRSIWGDTVVSVSLVLLGAVPLIVASALILFGEQIETALRPVLAQTPHLSALWLLVNRLARYALAFATTVTVMMLMYYFGPNRRQRWTRVWPGAVVATVLLTLNTAGFGWYVRNMANYNVLYGSVGTSIALLVWMYLMAAIALLGCEFNAEYERLTM